MAIKKKGPAAAVTTAATTVLGTVDLGAAYGRVFGFQAANWASSAKAAEGTDALEKVKLSDATGRVFYLDAADRDYGATSGPAGSAASSGTTIMFSQDETVTGVGDIYVDATGAAVASGAGGPSAGAVAKSPVTVEIQSAGTATDYFEVYLYVEI
jgi:hypothetical protein